MGCKLEESHTGYGPLFFGYDPIAVAGIFLVHHGDHTDSPLMVPWDTVEELLEQMRTYFSDINPTVQRQIALIRGGMDRQEAWLEANRQSQREEEIGEP